MNDPYGPAIIDHARSVPLPNGYLAAMLVDNGGVEYLMIVNPHGIGNTAVFDPTCRTVGHEQTGPLDAETIRRIAE
jgi:hypothetical protein